MIEVPIIYIPTCLTLHVFEIAGILYLLIREVIKDDYRR